MKQKYNLARIFSFLFILTTSIFTISLLGSSGGKTGRTTLSTSPGCNCHGTASSSVSVVIDGPTELEVNETGSFSVTVSGGAATAAGVNIAASEGTLSPVSSTLQLIGAELTHTNPVTFAGNQVVFEFDYTATDAEGSITLAAAGNSVNQNGGTSGDTWNHASEKIVTVSPATAIADLAHKTPNGFSLQQNYPNPFNPATNIKYNLEEAGMVSLRIFDVLGREVASLVDAWKSVGQHQTVFNAAEFESGTYFYILSQNGKQQARKMMLLK